jgi:hypothetical protein
MAVWQVLGSLRFIGGQAGAIAFVSRYIKEGCVLQDILF